MDDADPAASHDGTYPAAGAPNGNDNPGRAWPRPEPTEPTRTDLLARVAYLENRLTTLPAIEQAKGALMLTYGLSADAAFDLLRFHSQNRNVKVRAIAAQLSTLMWTAPTTAEAIARFDRLLDDVAQNLQPISSPAGSGRRGTAAGAAVPTKDAASWPVIPPDELPEVMLRAVATAPPGITIAGNAPDFPLVYANDAFTAITGYPIKEILGRNCRFLQGTDTDPRDIGKISRAIRDGREFSVVMRNYRSDGAPFWNEVSISPIRDPSNRITHFIGTQIDITERVDQQSAVSAPDR